MDLLFSPQNDLQDCWIKHINAAARSIHIACFGISDPAIVSALCEASLKRRIEVIILEDRTQSKLPADRHRDLAAAGCKVVIKRSRVLLHDKMGVFDGNNTIIGSWNLTESAQRQDNSDVVLDGDPAAAAQIEEAWERIFHRETGLSYQPGMQLPPITPAE